MRFNGSRFNGSAVDEDVERGIHVGATRGRPLHVSHEAPQTDINPDPTVNREPLNREPIAIKIPEATDMDEKQSKNLNQYLTFTLDKELYAMDIAKVREVLEYTDITRVPRTPEFLRGVINVRGRAVPVVDMRLKFGLTRTERTVNTCIIITEVDVDGESTVLGALADSVREVFDLEPDQIEPAPRLGTRIKTEFIEGMGKQGDEFIIILNIDKIFSADELSVVLEVGEEEARAA